MAEKCKGILQQGFCCSILQTVRHLCSYPENKMANMANNKVSTHFYVGVPIFTSFVRHLCSYPQKKMANMANMANNYEFYEKCYRKLYKQVKLLSPLPAALLRLHVSMEVTFVCRVVAVRTLFQFSWFKSTPFLLFTLYLSKKTQLLSTTISF